MLCSGHWGRLLKNSPKAAQPRVQDCLISEDYSTEVPQIPSVPMFDFKSIRFIWSHAGFSLMFAELWKYSYWTFQTGGLSRLQLYLGANDQAVWTLLSFWPALMTWQMIWPTWSSLINFTALWSNLRSLGHFISFLRNQYLNLSSEHNTYIYDLMVQLVSVWFILTLHDIILCREA